MAFLQIPVNFYRTQAEALDTTEVYSTYQALTSYANTSPYVYAGQICSVIDDGAYIINSNKTVTKLGTGTGTGAGLETTANAQYRSDYASNSATYIGKAAPNVQESSPQWTIKKSIYSSSGTFISSVSSINMAWTNRYTL